MEINNFLKFTGLLIIGFYITGVLMSLILFMIDYLLVCYCNRWNRKDMLTIFKKDNLSKMVLLLLGSWLTTPLLFNHIEKKTSKKISK